MSKSNDLADAIVSCINGAGYSFTAERRASPLTAEEAERLDSLRVIVFAGAKRIERQTRREFQRTYKPLLAVYRRLDGGSDENNRGIADGVQDVIESLETLLETTDFTVNDNHFAFMAFDEGQDRETHNHEALAALNVVATSIVLEYACG